MNDAMRFRAALEEAGLNQVEAAHKLDLTDRTVRRYCAGDQPVPVSVWLSLTVLIRRRRRRDRHKEHARVTALLATEQTGPEQTGPTNGTEVNQVSEKTEPEKTEPEKTEPEETIDDYRRMDDTLTP